MADARQADAEVVAPSLVNHKPGWKIELVLTMAVSETTLLHLLQSMLMTSFMVQKIHAAFTDTVDVATTPVGMAMKAKPLQCTMEHHVQVSRRS